MYFQEKKQNWLRNIKTMHSYSNLSPVSASLTPLIYVIVQF